jgi:hypothetical protein
MGRGAGAPGGRAAGGLASVRALCCMSFAVREKKQEGGRREEREKKRRREKRRKKKGIFSRLGNF